MPSKKHIAIIGGGAAGCFAAANIANPNVAVTIYEASDTPLAKVRISGGGRCNVTNHTLDISEFIKNYPRGEKELRSVFSRFHVKDVMAWFEQRGVKLKIEADRRVFPVSDDSTSITNCLLSELKKQGSQLKLGQKVQSINRTEQEEFLISFANGRTTLANKVMLATGGSRHGYELAQMLGHQITPTVPSLFSFKLNDKRLNTLQGLSINQVELKLVTSTGDIFRQNGPLLVTHWGLSGPAIIKLSAFAAKALAHHSYTAKLVINFLPTFSPQTLEEALKDRKSKFGTRQLCNDNFLPLPKSLWQSLLSHCLSNQQRIWADLTKIEIKALIQELNQGTYHILGKGAYKEEFVTCGGVNLKEVNFKAMESKLCPGLYLMGEILDIDGITGGFNFQNAWSTAWIASQQI